MDVFIGDVVDAVTGGGAVSIGGGEGAGCGDGDGGDAETNGFG